MSDSWGKSVWVIQLQSAISECCANIIEIETKPGFVEDIRGRKNNHIFLLSWLFGIGNISQLLLVEKFSAEDKNM